MVRIAAAVANDTGKRMDNSNPPPRRALPPPSPRRRWIERIAGLVVLVVLIWAGWHWWLRPHLNPPATSVAGNAGPTAVAPRNGTGSRGRFQAAGPQPVGAATITKGDIDITLNALGSVVPLATVTVQTQISGQLTEIGFTEGQLVKKGDFLFQIDPRPYQVALEQAQGQLARDQALLKGATVDLARYQKLAKQNSIAQQQADDQLYLVKQYEGTVKLDEAQVDNARLNLAYCHITAPVTGRVGLRLIDVGNYVTSSSTTGLVVLTELQPITVVFPVAEDFLPQIQKRMVSDAKLPVTAYDRSGTTKLATGTLFAIDSQIDPTTGTVKMKAQFDNADLALFPQQFVNAQLLIDTLKDVVIAPTASIQRGAPGTFVFVIKPDNKVAVTKVRLGPVQGEKVAVLSGLSEGEKVVVDGADRLRDGSPVTIPQAGGKSGGSARRAAGGTAPGSAPPAQAAGSNLGSSSPVKGRTPDVGPSNGPGYNPPPVQPARPPAKSGSP